MATTLMNPRQQKLTAEQLAEIQIAGDGIEALGYSITRAGKLVRGNPDGTETEVQITATPSEEAAVQAEGRRQMKALLRKIKAREAEGDD